MHRCRWPVAIAGVFVALIVVACAPEEPAFRGTDLSAVDWGGDHQLRAHTGVRMHLSDVNGKVAVLFFGYVHCPDICGPTLAKLAEARRMLGRDAGRVQIFFVSVDPARDTPAQIGEFLARFDSSFIGLTGTPAEIEEILRDYKISAAPSSAGRIAHSGGVFIRDAEGKLRVYHNDTFAVADLVNDLRQLIVK